MNSKTSPSVHNPSARCSPIMSWGAALLVLAFVVFTIADPAYAGAFYDRINKFITVHLGWYYIGFLSSFLFFCVWLAFSRYGKLRLGQDSDRPEFSDFTWFSMLFGAGIGTGILFWSIAEPIYHYQSNPFLASGQAMTVEAAQVAMRITIFHWGLHGWAIFAVVGLMLAYFSYRKGLPLSIRSSLYPLIGDRIYGPIGHAADLLAVLGTVFGIATSLGMGAQQTNTGMAYLLGWEVSVTNQIILIAVITVIATASVMTGLGKGIRILSELNMHLTAVTLALFVVLGPTAYLLGSVFSNIGDYLAHAIPMGLWVDPDPKHTWQGAWTVFYWGWWIAWAPFVGIFVARISKGRTVREFILGVLLAPTLLSAIWITVFGNSAMFVELFGTGGIKAAVNEDITMALFKTVELMQLGHIPGLLVSGICGIMLWTYFITAGDAATLVIATLASMGNEHPPAKYRLFWGLSLGAVAAVLLLAGGLKALQTASVIAALPFSIVVLLAAIGFLKALRQEAMGTSTSGRVDTAVEAPSILQSDREPSPDRKLSSSSP